MTADTDLMREAASSVASQKTKYDSAIAEIDQLVTATLGQYWGDEAYDALKAEFENKSRGDLKNLSETLQEFSTKLTDAANDLDERIGRLA